jgi:hypothetical protein
MIIAWGNAHEHQRACVLIANPRHRRSKCSRCAKMGIRKYATHAGTANGVCLMSGCEWHVRAWVRKP